MNATQQLHSYIAARLTAATVTRADLWALQYRYMGEPFPGRFTFKYHPWTKEMLCSDAEENAGQKAAQMGFTDSVGINRAFYVIDQKKQDVLYVLPAKTPDATDFSSGRFDPALERSEYLRSLFTNVNNVGLKRAGTNSLYVRGSRSRSAMKSLPVGLIVLDESDEFDEEAVVLVRERISGQREGARQLWHLSTPSIPNHGVNIPFTLSDQRHFFFKCPSCSKLIELTYPESIVVTADDPNDLKINESHYICTECKKPLPSEIKDGVDWAKVDYLNASGQWVATYPDRFIRGYTIPQMYSCLISASRFAKASLLALTSPAEEQEFYNSKIGTTHIVEGASVNDEHLDACISDYRMRDPKLMSAQVITMGVDVGKKLHCEIIGWTINRKNSVDVNEEAEGKVIFATTVKEFTDVDNLIYTFRPACTVIDDMPDTRSALALARRHKGRVKLCHYGTSTYRDISDYGERITVDRTSWLDLSLGRFIKGNIRLPLDIPKEYRDQVKALIRVPEKDKHGNPYYVYRKTNEDHYGHARNYAEIALKCAHFGTNTRPMSERTR